MRAGRKGDARHTQGPVKLRNYFVKGQDDRMLKRIELEAFKGFEHFVLSFNPQVTVLVGPNNAGKRRSLSG